MDTQRSLLNATEVARELGIGKSTFHKYRKRYEPLFRVARPIGQRRYSLELVRRYKLGQSMAMIGNGSRRDR